MNGNDGWWRNDGSLAFFNPSYALMRKVVVQSWVYTPNRLEMINLTNICKSIPVRNCDPYYSKQDMSKIVKAMLLSGFSGSQWITTFIGKWSNSKTNLYHITRRKFHDDIMTSSSDWCLLVSLLSRLHVNVQIIYCTYWGWSNICILSMKVCRQ